MTEQRSGEAHADHMADDEGRNAEAEHELGQFDAGPAKLPARIERPDAEAEMDQHGAVEQTSTGQLCQNHA